MDAYTYQMQPRVDGFLLPDTYEANLYRNHLDFSGPVVLTHELDEVNWQASDGVGTDTDVVECIRIFFAGIADDAVGTLLEQYPPEDYSSVGLRFSDMKQSFDLTAKDIVVALGEASHGTDQNYYWYRHVHAVDVVGCGHRSLYMCISVLQ